MDYSKYQYTILCEDKAHYNLTRGWLLQKGANDRRIRTIGQFPHDGSGKSFVIKNYEEAINRHNSIFAKTNAILIVFIDADNESFDSTMATYSNHESKKVFFVIAKWSIETWFHFILTEEVCNEDDQKTYKQQYRKNTKPTALGKKLAKLNFEAPNVPLSLKTTHDYIKTKKIKLGLSN